ncbi:hypothetical protein LGT41_0012260 [Abyssibius alkaniclasticus]|uniref:hypothetical protein n=1 Tax=Abyssibius alkaniclasticus TaxID=2881234 RepID=UPI0023637837|nr:hypothetical protein [Abyssibius alkaniclasticus]UPH70558.1 hypothetical protein LGT41_0012260 [Abyssibius alkaniclasticus]
MSLGADIIGAWRQGWGNALRRQMASGAGEERALGWVMVATVMLVAAQMPASYKAAAQNIDQPEQAPIAVLMIAVFSLFLAPLSFYALAALSHLVARLLGATGPFLNARLGLFWALLCVAPLALISAAFGNSLGPELSNPLQYVVLLVFLVIWADTMHVAEGVASRLRAGLALGVVGASIALVIGLLFAG